MTADLGLDHKRASDLTDSALAAYALAMDQEEAGLLQTACETYTRAGATAALATALFARSSHFITLQQAQRPAGRR